MTANPTGLTLATKITLVRLMGVPVFVLLLVYYNIGLAHGEEHTTERLMALVVFILVAGTDALDGYLARARNEITNLGKVLDPLADKALLLSGLILLTRPGLEPRIPIWFTTLVISRDVVLVGGYFLTHHFAGAVDVHPRWSGKIATVLQMGIILWVLSQFSSQWFYHVVAAAGVFTAISFVQYVVDGSKQLAKASHKV